MEKDPLVEVTDLDRHFPELKKDVKEALKKALIYLEKEDKKLEVSLLSKGAMKKVNSKFRGKDEATNVLSFEEPDQIPTAPKKRERLGEIYICPEVIEEEGAEPVYLTIHGLLHLLGFSHKEKEDAKRMEEVEKEIMQKIGN
ncbi:MAG: rRNA maturation RNase YbeY [Candidatus Magasanikbacteria bacterium]